MLSYMQRNSKRILEHVSKTQIVHSYVVELTESHYIHLYLHSAFVYCYRQHGSTAILIKLITLSIGEIHIWLFIAIYCHHRRRYEYDKMKHARTLSLLYKSWTQIVAMQMETTCSVWFGSLKPFLSFFFIFVQNSFVDYEDFLVEI